MVLENHIIYQVRLKTKLYSMNWGKNYSKKIVCFVCMLIALSSMTCEQYRNVSEGQYLTEGFCQYTDSMPVILACGAVRSHSNNRSRLRIEQCFKPLKPFTLFANDIWLRYDGELFKPIMRDIHGKKIDSLNVSCLTPVAFDVIVNKGEEELFGDSVMLVETIRQSSYADTLKMGFLIRKEDSPYPNEQYDSLMAKPKYREIAKFYFTQKKVESYRFFFWRWFSPVHRGERDFFETVTPAEAVLLDSLFESERGDFSFAQKKVVFIMNLLGPVCKADYFDQSYEDFGHRKNSICLIDRGALYIFTPEQKQLANDCDAAILYWSRVNYDNKTVGEIVRHYLNLE